MAFFALKNVMTYRRGSHEIWLGYVAATWGIFLVLHAISVFSALGGWGKRREERKLRELTSGRSDFRRSINRLRNSKLRNRLHRVRVGASVAHMKATHA